MASSPRLLLALAVLAVRSSAPAPEQGCATSEHGAVAAAEQGASTCDEGSLIQLHRNVPSAAARLQPREPSPDDSDPLDVSHVQPEVSPDDYDPTNATNFSAKQPAVLHDDSTGHSSHAQLGNPDDYDPTNYTYIPVQLANPDDYDPTNYTYVHVQPGVSPDNYLPLNITSAPRLAGNLRERRMARTRLGTAGLGSVPVCKISASNSCPMSGFGGKPTMVVPGGGTSCLRGADGPYGFLVTPGSRSRVLLYFQGGGACFSELTFYLETCTQNISVALNTSGTLGGAGIFNTSNPENVYRNYTVIEVLYCSGDAFVGNAMQHWLRAPRPQVGYRNAEAALNWTLANTDKRLMSLTIAGDSAGALGAQAWANLLLQQKFAYRRAAVIVDSYAGYFPAQTTSWALQLFHACTLPVFTRKEQKLCLAGRLEIPTFMQATIAGNPGVAFGFLQSKADEVQRAFYDLVFETYYRRPSRISGPDFYFGTNAIFQHYFVLPNVVTFYVDGETHTFTQQPYYLTAGTLGPEAGSSAGRPLMHTWVTRFVRSVNCPSGQCSGPKESNSNDSTAYCDSELFPKRCTTTRALPGA